jgi:hypothetical protein
MDRYLNRFNSTIVRELYPPRNTKITPLRLVFFIRLKCLSFRSGENIPRGWYFLGALFLVLSATLRVKE